ncbi:MAG: SDR family NAD(P)-dependent oxidoreductase, partial [Pseudomonadota bacterium]
MDHQTGTKTAVVTGASRGIGRAIAVELASQGYFIVINYRSDQTGAAQTLELVQQAGSLGSVMQFDVADREQAKTAVEAIIENRKTIDVLVNNAGITADGL